MLPCTALGTLGLGPCQTRGRRAGSQIRLQLEGYVCIPCRTMDQSIHDNIQGSNHWV